MDEDHEYLKDSAKSIREDIDDIYPEWLKERDDELSKRERKRFNVDPETNLWFSRLYSNPGEYRSHLQTVYAAMEDFLLDIIEFSSEFVEGDEPDYHKDFEKFFRTFRTFPGTQIFGKCEKDRFEDRIVPDDVKLIDKIREAITGTELSNLEFEFGRNDNLPFLGNGRWADEYSADDLLIIRVHVFPYTNHNWKDDRYFELPAKRTSFDAKQDALNICRKIQYGKENYEVNNQNV